MTTIPKILIVHADQNGDKVKEFLLKKFPVFERYDQQIATTDVEFLYNRLIVEKFDILIATTETKPLEIERKLRDLRERPRPVLIEKAILPEFKIIQFNLKEWKFASDS